MPMRLVLAVLLLTACSSKASSGPAWPKMTDKEVDGGESLAPRAKASAVAAKSDDDDKPAAAADKPAAAATPKTDAETPKPATTTGSTQVPADIIITTEEIIIEIDD